MPRPPFSLTDDQARTLAASVALLEADYPLDQRNHRPFVRAFLLAVQAATGKWYSPAIYHRLLAAFAPQRRPSTATLATEKQALQATASTPPAAAGEPVAPGPVAQTVGTAQLQVLVAEAVDASLARVARFGGSTAQLEFYEARLRDAEQALLAVRAEAARLASELAVARQSVTLYQQECLEARAALVKQTEAVSKLTAEVTDIRKFALQSIDEARGESRVWKERCVALEAHRQQDARLLETFRQHAYRAGAAIPDILKQEKPR